MSDPNRYFCLHQEADLANVTKECKWPAGMVVRLFQELSLSGFTSAQIQAVFDRVAHEWSAVCGINLVAVTSAAGANIVAQSGKIDGPNGVLGQSYLPCGNVGPGSKLDQLFDNSEPWGQDNELLRVVLHEVGHACGLEHSTDPGAVMYPYLTEATAPQAWDIAQMQARYGPPQPVAPPPAPEPEPGPAPDGSATIRIDEPGLKAGTYVVYFAGR